MAARIDHLDKKLKKKKFGGITTFNLPRDVETGSQEHLKTLNEMLKSRVEYLESVLKGR